MVLFDLLFAAVIALLLALIFAVGFRREGFGAPLWIFFLLLFLLIWAGGIWVTPIGPPLWGVPWLSFLLIGIIFALLLTAFLPPARRPRSRGEAIEQARSQKNAAWVVGVFFWLLILALVIAIIVGYL